MYSNIYNSSMLQLADVIIDTFGSSSPSSYKVPVEVESSDDASANIPMISFNEDVDANEDVIPIPIGPSESENEDIPFISLVCAAAEDISEDDPEFFGSTATNIKNTEQENVKGTGRGNKDASFTFLQDRNSQGLDSFAGNEEENEEKSLDPMNDILILRHRDPVVDLSRDPQATLGWLRTAGKKDEASGDPVEDSFVQYRTRLVIVDSSSAPPHKLLGNHNNSGDSVVNNSKQSGSTRPPRKNTAKRRFSKIKDNNNGIPAALECRKIDVLLGRGGHASNHPGNLELLRAVKANRARYKNLKKTLNGVKEKKVIILNIVSKMLSKGSRFLYREKKGEEWREASNRAIYEKVSHMLRNK